MRSREHPWGFPWVKKRLQHQLELGNELVRFSIQVCEAVVLHPTSFDGFPVFLFGEHPEDLGAVVREEDGMVLCPASIWQLQAIRSLVEAPGSPVFTIGLNQCCWGAAWRKPTRLLATAACMRAWGPTEWPTFSGDGFYLGPLSKSCQCQITTSLARKKDDSSFRTTGTDVYPPKLDEAIAQAMIDHILASMSAVPDGGGETEDKEKTDSGKPLSREKGKESQEKSEGGTPPSQKKENSGKGGESGSPPTLPKVEEVRKWKAESVAREGPIRCYYKGKHRVIHDGGGLTSPGRLPVEKREETMGAEGTRVASEIRQMFLEWIQSRSEGSEDGVKECFWKLAGGRFQESPFGASMDLYRERLDVLLEQMGLEPRRKPGDRDSQVNFRRLRAMLRAIQDVDWGWLEEVASEGVSLGVDEELPRVPEVFEEKEKWNLSFAEEDFKDTFAENYKSAEESSADIARQVKEEVARGSIVSMSLKEAEETFKGRLAIAALGAVPKEQGSSVVRIVHGGSYSVDVNHRIKVRDRMRFPTIDDAAGVLLHLEDQVQESGGLARFSMLYDVARAHKLLPVKRRDWGFQAFRLPGSEEDAEDGDRVFLHTRGTFGIASAAYWWQRLAACLVRLCHRLAGRALGILHLLFADDGWMVATGSYFWRKCLFWLFVLDLVEVPLSWKKVRGGTCVQWIGYQLDVADFTKGISDKKVRWVEGWMEKHLASGGVLGRDLKSALGRFGFVAGALHHVRPFLGPLYAWAAVLSPGTYAKFPAAVGILMEYIRMQISVEPMSKPRRVSERSPEVFRVDAKAEGECIVIGGWELSPSGRREDSRWFSIRLIRKNAP